MTSHGALGQNKKSSAASPDAKKRWRFYSGAAPPFLPGHEVTTIRP